MSVAPPGRRTEEPWFGEEARTELCCRRSDHYMLAGQGAERTRTSEIRRFPDGTVRGTRGDGWEEGGERAPRQMVSVKCGGTNQIKKVKSGTSDQNIQDENSVQFSFIYMAPYHNRSYLGVLFIKSRSRTDS